MAVCCRNLGMDYLDLYLIHWPVSADAAKVEYPIRAEDFAAMEFGSVWAAMEECLRIGLTKAIGVSNFSSKKLLEILATAKIPPAVNQVSSQLHSRLVEQKIIDRSISVSFTAN